MFTLNLIYHICSNFLTFWHLTFICLNSDMNAVLLKACFKSMTKISFSVIANHHMYPKTVRRKNRLRNTRSHFFLLFPLYGMALRSPPMLADLSHIDMKVSD